MPFDGNKWSKGKFMPYEAMLEKIRYVFPDLKLLETEASSTSKVSSDDNAFESSPFNGCITIGRAKRLTSLFDNKHVKINVTNFRN